MKKFIPQNIVAHSIIIFILALFFATPSYAHTEEELLRKYVTNLINDGYKLFNNAKISKAERDKKSAQLLKDNLYLDFSGQSTAISTEISIFDIQGKVVKTINRTNETVQNIAISELKSGFYLLKIPSEDGRQRTEKFVIN